MKDARDYPYPNYERVDRNEMDGIVYSPIHPSQPIYSPGTIFKSVICQVCLNIIEISGLQNQIAVQCAFCHEATPIKNPPAGQHFFRCPCDCLLIVRVTSSQVVCSRRRCGKLLKLSNGNIDSVFKIKVDTAKEVAFDNRLVTFSEKTTENTSTMEKRRSNLSSGTNRFDDNEIGRRISTIGMKHNVTKGIIIKCGKCGLRFVIEELAYNTAARCPHCLSETSVGVNFARRKWILLLTFAAMLWFLLCVPSIYSIVRTDATGNIKLISLGPLFIVIALLFRACYYCLMPVSTVVSKGLYE